MKLLNKIKEILGIDKLEKKRIQADARIDKLFELGEIGVDLGVHEKSDSYIILASKLHGGVVKIIPMYPNNPREFLELAKNLESRYEIKNPIKDLPRGIDWRY